MYAFALVCVGKLVFFIPAKDFGDYKIIKLRFITMHTQNDIQLFVMTFTLLKIEIMHLDFTQVFDINGQCILTDSCTELLICIRSYVQS